MTWTEKDEVLFSIVNIEGREHLEAQIENASKKFVKLKKRPDFFVIFGYYNLNKDAFVWQNNMNKISFDFVKKNYMRLFESDETLKKLFQPTVKFDRKNMNVIPYLMEALNADFNVVRFKSSTDYIYALTKVDGIKQTFDYDKFNGEMLLYRLQIMGIIKPINKSKHKKRNNRHQTHKNKRKERV